MEPGGRRLRRLNPVRAPKAAGTSSIMGRWLMSARQKAESTRAKTRPSDEEIALACRALSHPVRIGILRHIASRDTFCGDLVPVFGLAQSTISHHLRILREAGLIEGEERGPATCYRVRRDRCEALCALVQDLLRQPGPSPSAAATEGVES